jgi:hypothetical protein
VTEVPPDARHSSLTRLVLPVPELIHTVPSAAIPLLVPFLPADRVDDGVLAELVRFFGALVPFVYVLGEPARFPTGAAYLPPEPIAPLRRIVLGLRRAFPEAADPTSLVLGTPHLPLPEGVHPEVPVVVRAREARLLGVGAAGEGERVLATFAFGTSAA